MNPWFLVSALAAILIGKNVKASMLPKGQAPKWRGTQDDIIAAVRAGNYQLTWHELPSHPGVEVSEDALRIDGIRVPVSARTVAAICQILGTSPTTALLDDIIYDQAVVRVVPPTFNVADPEAVWRFSRGIDEQIAAQTLDRPGGLVSCVGKSWVLSNLAAQHPGKAINYGLHSPSAPYVSVNGRSKVWQQPSWAHNPDHADYSQVCRLVRLAPGAYLPSPEKLRVSTLWVEKT